MVNTLLLCLATTAHGLFLLRSQIPSISCVLIGWEGSHDQPSSTEWLLGNLRIVDISCKTDRVLVAFSAFAASLLIGLVVTARLHLKMAAPIKRVKRNLRQDILAQPAQETASTQAFKPGYLRSGGSPTTAAVGRPVPHHDSQQWIYSLVIAQHPQHHWWHLFCWLLPTGSIAYILKLDLVYTLDGQNIVYYRNYSCYNIANFAWKFDV